MMSWFFCPARKSARWRWEFVLRILLMMRATAAGMRGRGVMNRLWMRMRRAVHPAAVHAGASAIAFGAGAGAIVCCVRVLLRAWVVGVLDAAIAADLAVVTVVATVGRVLNAAVASN
jgi:hypothetical protein